jgi:acyl carrier protein
MQVRAENDVRGWIRAVIVELAPNPEGASTEDPRLIEDLNFHSLALVELAFTLEDEFELAAMDAQAVQAIRTVKDVEDHVVNELRRRPEALLADASG